QKPLMICNICSAAGGSLVGCFAGADTYLSPYVIETQRITRKFRVNSNRTYREQVRKRVCPLSGRNLERTSQEGRLAPCLGGTWREQVRKRGLPPLSGQSGGKPPFLTCSFLATLVLSSQLSARNERDILPGHFEGRLSQLWLNL